jgi:2-hydroxychromene-2-carboxylate isomerase
MQRLSKQPQYKGVKEMFTTKMKKSVLLCTGLAAAFALALGGCKKGGGAGDAPKSTVAEKVKVEFFVMSQCPFGVQVLDGIAPVLKKMGGDVEFTVDFIGQEKDGKLTSMHGDKEVDGDKVELCAAKYAPYKFMDMVTCMDKNSRAIPDNWESCAKDAGLPVDSIKTCFTGDEGKALLKASFDKATSRNARGSPTIFINGKSYNGGRSEMAFTRGICDGYPKAKPAVCSSIPPPVKVPVTIISDARCKDCNADQWKRRMEGMFPGADIKVMDWAQPEAKTMLKDLDVSLLPAIIFGKEVEQSDNYNQVSRFLTPKGESRLFQAGARFDPTKEICDNKADDNNNGKIDCDDPDCTNAMECRKEIPKKLEVFVMSQCPFGVKALNAMKEVLTAFNNAIQFEVHFIADVQGDGFKSLHGQDEVDENIREICAIKYYAKNYKYMDYIACRNKNIRDKNWQSCTGGTTGIDTKKIETCASGDEGKKLLREDIKVAQSLAVGGSPTWLANNKNKFSGLDPEAIKQNFCKFNQGLKGCEKKLSGPEAPAPGTPAPSCGQ